MNCPVCLSPSTAPAFTGSDILFETTTKQFQLQLCAACRCLFLNPPPSSDEIAAYYPPQYWWSGSRPTLLRRLESVYRRFALRGHIAFIRAAGRRLPQGSGMRLLDVGCGNGTLIGLLKPYGFDVLGVDSSAEAANVAREEHRVRVLSGTLGDAAFAGNWFDIVTMFHVMEHVSNPRELLAEVRRIVKPGGVVIVQVPNLDSWQFRWFGVRWYGLDVPRHVVDYSQSAILGLLESSGFRITRTKHFNLRDNAPALVSSLAPALDPLSRPIRLRRRNAREAFALSWAKHLTYLVLVVCAYPVALLEAAAGRGATVMIEAQKVNPDKISSRGDYSG
jgi:2-polyprenyl-3-methyl-5-hydroxy-6-metoxy-1,4-benzoquinol methylase